MAETVLGHLTPLGGGDPIPLLRKRLRVGRREGCDIILKFSNISSNHCLLDLEEGYWFIRDLNSRNGVKVNSKRIPVNLRKRIDPDEIVTIAKHQYRLEYDPHELGAFGTPPQDEQVNNLMGTSLLEQAGLQKRKKKEDWLWNEIRPGLKEKFRFPIEHFVVEFVKKVA